MAITIRPPTRQDLDSLLSLNAHVQPLHAAAFPSLFRSDTPTTEIAAAFREMLDAPDSLWLLAEDDSVPCGYLYARFQDCEENWCRPAFRFCNISHLVVDPRFRRRGVARQLLAATIQEANERGYPRIDLDVWSFNENARAAFRRLGFNTVTEHMTLGRPDKQGYPSRSHIET